MKVQVIFYSMYGHIYRLAEAVVEGARQVEGAEVALFQVPGPELWHPSPEFLYQPGAGPLLDMGPCYLTALIQLLGPIRLDLPVADRFGRGVRDSLGSTRFLFS